jgi:hypothetical protein
VKRRMILIFASDLLACAIVKFLSEPLLFKNMSVVSCLPFLLFF